MCDCLYSTYFRVERSQYCKIKFLSPAVVESDDDGYNGDGDGSGSEEERCKCIYFNEKLKQLLK